MLIINALAADQVCRYVFRLYKSCCEGFGFSVGFLVWPEQLFSNRPGLLPPPLVPWKSEPIGPRDWRVTNKNSPSLSHPKVLCIILANDQKPGSPKKKFPGNHKESNHVTPPPPPQASCHLPAPGWSMNFHFPSSLHCLHKRSDPDWSSLYHNLDVFKICKGWNTWRKKKKKKMGILKGRNLRLVHGAKRLRCPCQHPLHKSGKTTWRTTNGKDRAYKPSINQENRSDLNTQHVAGRLLARRKIWLSLNHSHPAIPDYINRRHDHYRTDHASWNLRISTCPIQPGLAGRKIHLLQRITS